MRRIDNLQLHGGSIALENADGARREVSGDEGAAPGGCVYADGRDGGGQGDGNKGGAPVTSRDLAWPPR